MKTLLIKILSLNFILLGLTHIAIAQFNWLPNTATPIPNHDLLQVQTGYFTVMRGTGVLPSTPLLGMGVNTETPSQMLSVLGGNYNIDGSTTQYGYMIGDQYVIWYNTENSSIMVGVGAGGGVGATSFVTGAANTLIGGNAGFTLGTSGGYGPVDNTFVGNSSGYSLLNGYDNTYLGQTAGFSDVSGTYNTFVGVAAGYSTTGTASVHPALGDYNTMTGYVCGYYNTTGYANCFYGKAAGFSNGAGYFNCMFGGHAGDNTQNTDSNCYYGSYCAYHVSNGNDNVFMGFEAGENPLLLSSNSNMDVFIGANSALRNHIGNYNIVLGYGADAYTGSSSSPGSITNAVAIGADALVLNNNTFILGNNSQSVGIGMSGSTSAPIAKLEVNQNSGVTGSMGIYVVNNDPTPLAVIVPPNGGVSGFGITNPSSVLEMEVNQPNGGTSLQANSTASATTNFGMQGIATNASYWNIGVQGSAGVGSGTSYNQGVYGLANNTYGYNYGVVGWANSSSGAYGLYSIGDIYTTGSGYAVGLWNPSDSTIKRKVNNLSNAISIIKKLQPRTYYYDSINKFNLKLDTFMHYGFIAQELKRSVPCMVRNIITPPQWDTNMHITVPASTINTVDYNQFTAILTAGFQEQMQISYNDSVKQKQTNDSLRYTLDSLRAAFKSIESCLTQLCNNGHGASRHTGGGSGNSGDSNATMLNTQDVTLSALANAPLLYQNIPNPFSTGTKINYFLPASTQGASIVFYDTYGNKIKTVELSQTGNGTLNITPDNLTSGIYSYSLVVNGNVVDTKRMILQK